MKKLLLIPVLALSLAACDEQFKSVTGGNQVFVEDRDGKINETNIQDACKRMDKVVARVQYIGNREKVLVTCK